MDGDGDVSCQECAGCAGAFFADLSFLVVCVCFAHCSLLAWRVCSHSIRLRLCAIFTGTFASIFIRTMDASIIARCRSFGCMVSRISSSGSGICGRRRAVLGCRHRGH